jgi:hypothetical protein
VAVVAVLVFDDKEVGVVAVVAVDDDDAAGGVNVLLVFFYYAGVGVVIDGEYGGRVASLKQKLQWPFSQKIG